MAAHAPRGDGASAPDTRRRVLLIEDEADVAELITYHLQKAGLHVTVARSGEEGLALARVPIIIISARSEETERILGLEMGADDYVVKPFSLKELATRCRVVLRRTDGAGEPLSSYVDENFEVEFDGYLVRYRGQEVRLTQKEFELFRSLVERGGRVLTRERLLERVWGFDTEVDVRSVDAHIRRLRMKLGPARSHVETVVGAGYRFVARPGAAD